MAPPFKVVEFDILYGQGVCRYSELLSLGVQAKIVDKSGAWYSYQGDKLGQGRTKVREFLIQNAHIADEIEQQVRQHYLPDVTPTAQHDDSFIAESE